MAYIGRGTDNISNVEVLDNITFSGASSYTLQKGSTNYVPISAANILVSIDGVVQANNFSVSGSTIDFGVAIANTSTCNFVLHFGTGLITTVQDGAITSTKIGSSAITSAKMASNSIATASVIDDAITYAKMQDTSAANRVLGAASAGTVGEVQVATDMIADAQVDESKLKISNTPTNGYFLSAQSGNTGGLTWAEAGGGKVNQVVQATKLNVASTTSTSFTDVSGMSVAITPSASNSKVLIMVQYSLGCTSGYKMYTQLVKGSTAIYIGNADANRKRASFGSKANANDDVRSVSHIFLDSPATTSATTYKLQMAVESGGTVYFGTSRSGADNNNSIYSVDSASITVSEILV